MGENLSVIDSISKREVVIVPSSRFDADRGIMKEGPDDTSSDFVVPALHLESFSYHAE